MTTAAATAMAFTLGQPVAAQDCLGVWRPGTIQQRHSGARPGFPGYPFLRDAGGHYAVNLIGGMIRDDTRPGGFRYAENVRVYVHERQIRAQH